MDRFFPLRSPNRKKANYRGFTLVEVLVALAVLAIALAAVLRAMGQAIDLSTDLRERTVALWAAQERATDHRLRNDWPALDTTEGKMKFGEREWRWHENVSKTPLDEMRRLEIEIRAPDSPDILGRLTVFLRRP
ncbi:MAG TPA: type II secretion system minor pseudopilin GspI [Burkholderiales bacterium]